ncbi:MAG: nitrate transporter ATP-binding protein [Rariglobus sp.]|jgi:ABC-type nitrate/sulfonate/bicarbonate transport system substrate-binding protein|nr:nitrate transporter ATP-binding protein [Rariglobus sp.]
MSSLNRKATASPSTQRPLRIGFIALNDAAPIIVAHENGFFQKHGLNIELSREVGWASIRDKIIHRELDASHALGAMVISTNLGLNCLPCECLTAFVLNTNGNCITLSEDLWNRGVRDASTMRDEIIRSRHERTYVFGVVFAHSSHRIHVCDWLRSAGVDPEKDVRVVVVPPPQLFRNLAAGTIDGYCVGDPWNSLAVREKIGWCPAISPDLAPGHAEKVLMVRRDFAESRSGEHLAMVAALSEAAALCDDPAFRPELCNLLARREYMNVPARVIQASLVGPFDYGHGNTVPADNFIHYHRNGANDPTSAKATWLIEGFNRHRFLPAGTVIPADLATRTFRSDLYTLAQKSSRKRNNHELAHA